MILLISLFKNLNNTNRYEADTTSIKCHSCVGACNKEHNRGSRVYLDKAVMEMHSDQGCRHPGLLGHSLCHNGLHNLFCLGARMVIELWEQATPWVAKDDTGKEEGRNKAEQDERTHGSCHDYLEGGFFYRTWIRIPVFGDKSIYDATAARLFLHKLHINRKPTSRFRSQHTCIRSGQARRVMYQRSNA